MAINKGSIIKTVGWSAIGLGLYLVTLGASYYDPITTNRGESDNVIDAEFTVVDES